MKATKGIFVVIFVLGINILGKAIFALHPSDAVITKYAYDWRPDGYSFEYETSSGIFRNERGYLKDLNGAQYLVTEGEFSYIGDDNEVYKVSYVADENGYRPTLHEDPTGGLLKSLLPLPEIGVASYPETYSSVGISSALTASLLGG